MSEEKEDFNIINEYHWVSYTRGFHILVKRHKIFGSEIKLKLTEEDFLNEDTLQFMTLNNITRK